MVSSRQRPGGSWSGRLAMNGTQNTETLFLNDAPRSVGKHFMNPDDVVRDPGLTRAEKREILASWASDRHAVQDAPSLRQLDNGAVVRVEDVLLALKSLDREARHPTPIRSRRFSALRDRMPTRLRSVLRGRRSDDDDDPPPTCPATIFGPFGGPILGGGTRDLNLASA